MARPQSPDQQQLHHDHIVSSAWTQHLSGAVTSAVEVVMWPNHASPWSSMQNSDKETKPNLSTISSAVLGLATVAGVLGQAEYDYTDDFSCPDELEGFYPHLYR